MFCVCGTWIDNVRKGFKSEGCPRKPHLICLDCGTINARGNKKCSKIIDQVYGFGRYSPINPVEWGCGSTNLVRIDSKEYKEFRKTLQNNN